MNKREKVYPYNHLTKYILMWYKYIVKIKGRLRLWVDSEIQLKIVLFALISLAIACAVVSIVTFYSIWSAVGDQLLRIEGVEQIYTASLRRFILTSSFLIILLAVLTALGMLIITHRVAGPAYRIRTILKDLYEGKNPTFALRKGDALKPLLEEIEKLAARYNDIGKSALAVIERWKSTEVRDMSLNLALKELENKLVYLSISEERERGEIKRKGGFSLIEIIIFCFIAITLLTLFVGLAFNSREFSRAMGCINNMKNISQAIENFQADYRASPRNLADLYPRYITDNRTFKCPADRTSDANSYEKFYIGRFFAEEDGQKVFLVCPRHNRGQKSVGAYLSYAVDIGKNSGVLWSGLPAKFGEVYSGGTLQFVDGTTVEINSGKVGLLASFTDNEGKLYHIIYTMEGEEGSFTVDHQGDSRFEVITPAVIAGVEGTKFIVRNSLAGNNLISSIAVLEGMVKVQDRSQDTSGSVVKPNQTQAVSVINATDVIKKKWVPRKPKKR